MELLCQHAQPLRRQRCRRCASDYERLLPTAYFCQSPAREVLCVEAEHFVNCIEQNNEPLTSGCVGLRVAWSAGRTVLGRRVNVVPFVDLKAQYQSIKPEIDAAIQNVLDSSQFVLGQEVENFEKEFAVYCQTEHALA